jgi:anti-sigma B factor antagonist
VNQFRVQTDEGAVSCTLSGDIDVANAGSIQSALIGLCGPGDQLTIDLSRVDFMDSMGLRMLMNVRQAADRVGTVVILTAIPRPVRRLLEITGLEDELPAVDLDTITAEQA